VALKNLPLDVEFAFGVAIASESITETFETHFRFSCRHFAGPGTVDILIRSSTKRNSNLLTLINQGSGLIVVCKIENVRDWNNG